MRLTEITELTRLADWVDTYLLYGNAKNPVELHVTPHGWEIRSEGMEPYRIEPDFRDHPRRAVLFEQTFVPGEISVTTEDSGQARIAEISDDTEDADEAGTFVRFQSWDPERNHTVFERFAAAKTARIVIDITEET